MWLGTPGQLKVRLWFFIVNQPMLWEVNHYALLQITPLSCRMTLAVFTRIDRSDDDSALVLPEFNPIT